MFFAVTTALTSLAAFAFPNEDHHGWDRDRCAVTDRADGCSAGSLWVAASRRVSFGLRDHCRAGVVRQRIGAGRAVVRESSGFECTGSHWEGTAFPGSSDAGAGGICRCHGARGVAASSLRRRPKLYRRFLAEPPEAGSRNSLSV